MTIHYTTNYHIAYADTDTAAVDLATVSQSVAASLDAAMGRAGYSPPDATTFAAEVAARQNADTALSTRVTALEHGAWITLPLLNGAAPIAGFRAPQYRQFSADRIELRGVIGSLPANGTAMAQLPPGFRPTAVEVLNATNDANANRVDLKTDGTIVRATGTGSYVTLLAVIFSTAP